MKKKNIFFVEKQSLNKIIQSLRYRKLTFVIGCVAIGMLLILNLPIRVDASAGSDISEVNIEEEDTNEQVEVKQRNTNNSIRNHITLIDIESQTVVAKTNIGGVFYNNELTNYISNFNNYYGTELVIQSSEIVNTTTHSITINGQTSRTTKKDINVYIKNNGIKDITTLKPIFLPSGLLYDDTKSGDTMKKIKIKNGNSTIYAPSRIEQLSGIINDDSIDETIRKAMNNIDSNKYYYYDVNVNTGFTTSVSNGRIYRGVMYDITVQVNPYKEPEIILDERHEVIPFESKSVESKELPAGIEKVTQPGKDGQKTFTTRTVKDYNEVIEGPTTTEEITVQPVDEITTIGTGVLTDEDRVETLEIPFDEKTIENSEIPKGQSKVIQQGVNGTKITTYNDQFLNGEPYGDPSIVTEEVTKKPTTEIIEIGTATENIVNRISGANRYRNAVAISQSGWMQSDKVFISNGDKFADALTGSPLAALNDAPLLLINGDHLNEPVKEEITRLQPKEVVILGGTSSVYPEVENELRELGVEVTRIGGKNRYEQAALVADEIFKLTSNQKREVFVAVGDDFSDALNIATTAAKEKKPILLTNPDHLNKHVLMFDDKVTEFTIVGGPNTIHTAVENQLKQNNLPVNRLSGRNRYALNRNILSQNQPSNKHYYIVSGEHFSDALPTSVLAAKNDAGILFVKSDNAVNLEEQYSYAMEQNIYKFTFIGGTSTISENTANYFKEIPTLHSN